MNIKNFFFADDKVFWWIFLGATLTLLGYVFFYNLTTSDIGALYARAVREFGCGRYEYAFPLDNPPLLTVFAGSVMKLGLGSFTSIKIVLYTFFIACMFPLRSIMQRMLPDNLASWTCLAFIFSSYVFRSTVLGLLLPMKVFFMLLSVYFIIKYIETFQYKYSAFLGIALGLLALSRPEGVAFVPFFIFWFIVFVIIRWFKKDDIIFPRYLGAGQYLNNSCLNLRFNSFIKKLLMSLLLVLVLFFIISLPQILYVYNETGFPSVEQRSAYLIKKKLAPYFPTISDNKIESSISGDVSLNLERMPVPLDNDGENPLNQIRELLLGLFKLYIFLSIFGFIFLLRNRKFSVFDLFFLSIIVFNISIFLCFFIIGRRYIAATLPFELSWVVLGSYYIYNFNFFKLWKKLIILVFGFILGIMYFDCNLTIRQQIWGRNDYKIVGGWIDEHRLMFSDEKIKNTEIYNTNRTPVIFTNSPQYMYYAKGDWLPDNGYCFPYTKLVKYMRYHNASVIIMDSGMKGLCPDFEKNYKDNFDLVKDFKKSNIQVYKLRQNL